MFAKGANGMLRLIKLSQGTLSISDNNAVNRSSWEANEGVEGQSGLGKCRVYCLLCIRAIKLKFSLSKIYVACKKALTVKIPFVRTFRSWRF